MHQNNVTLIHDAVERLEALLVDVKKQLTATTSGGSIDTIAIKNQVTSLFNIAMQESRDNISTTIHKMTSDIAKDLKSVKAEIKEVSTIAVSLASGSPMCNNPMLGVDIMDELKSLSANINSMESKIISSSPDSIGCQLSNMNTIQVNSSPDSIKSLGCELSKTKTIQAVVQSGWRRIGTRKVWKADWTDYDQGIDEVTTKRKKHAHNNNNISKNTHHNNRSRSSPRNNYNNRYYNHNNNSIDRDFNYPRGHGSRSLLPPDRILLAAAKERFSKLPEPSDAPTTHRPIKFQRGEILNPYPRHDEFPRSTPGRQPTWMPHGCSSNSGTSCEACHTQHTCFQR